MKKHKIAVVVKTISSGFVESRMYFEDGSKILGLAGSGEQYHLGQLSSTQRWAVHDVKEHFKKELNELFPEGYEFHFEFVEDFL